MPDPQEAMPALPEPGLYRHYKGGLYTLVCVGRHSETEEWLVTYRSEDPGPAQGSFWLRPLAMWSEPVDGVPRFARYSPARRSPN